MFGYRNVSADELGRGPWLLVNIDTDVIWPDTSKCLSYRGSDVYIFSVDGDKVPAVGICLKNVKDPHSLEEQKRAQKLLCNFLSALAWHEGKFVNIKGFTFSGYPARYSIPNQRIQTSKVTFFDEIPHIGDEKKLLALALFREANGINNTAYKFLSYFKILNVKFSGGKDQISWINNNLDLLTGPARGRVKELKAIVPDVGEYLYGSGRCAVAHANASQVINPDNFDDYQRLAKDMPLIASLAVKFIETEYDIVSSYTRFTQHLYELDGFKKIFGSQLKDYQTADEIDDEFMPNFPRLSIRLRGEENFELLEAINSKVIAYDRNGYLVSCLAQDKGFECFLFLNFEEERLQTDFFNQGVLFDNGSAEAMDRIADFFEFRSKLLMNGVLEVWDFDNNILLGRCDAYLPLNMMYDPVAGKKQIDDFRSQANERRQAA